MAANIWCWHRFEPWFDIEWRSMVVDGTWWCLLVMNRWFLVHVGSWLVTDTWWWLLMLMMVSDVWWPPCYMVVTDQPSTHNCGVGHPRARESMCDLRGKENDRNCETQWSGYLHQQFLLSKASTHIVWLVVSCPILKTCLSINQASHILGKLRNMFKATN